MSLDAVTSCRGRCFCRRSPLGAFFYHVSPKFKVCTICPAFLKFDHCLNEIERKHCTGNVTLQLLYGYLYFNGGVALAKMLDALLGQRLKVTAVLVVCCKMDVH